LDIQGADQENGGAWYLMNPFVFLLKLITGSGGIVSNLSKAYEKKLEAQSKHDVLLADLDIANMEAELEARRQAKAIRLETAGFWEMRLAVGIVAVATACHYAAVILDSIYQFSWDVAALPAPMDQWEGTIILSFFGLQGAVGIGSALVRRLK
jgi:hypothetical protein